MVLWDIQLGGQWEDQREELMVKSLEPMWVVPWGILLEKQWDSLWGFQLEMQLDHQWVLQWDRQSENL